MNPPEIHCTMIRHQLNAKDPAAQLGIWASSMNRAIGQINGVSKMLYDVIPKEYGLVRAQDTLFADLHCAFDRFFAEVDSMRSPR